MAIPQFNSTTFDKSVKTIATDFSGGVNFNDIPSQIADNQSPNMLNMWYKNGACRTRPGLIGASVQDKSKKTINQNLLNTIKAQTDFYVPTIFTNCNHLGGGNQNEDRNIMTPKVIMSFSPAAGDKTFKLADTNIDNTEIDISYQAPMYTKVENYTISAGSSSTQFTNDQGNTYSISIDRTQGLITWAYVSGNLTTKDSKGNTIPMTPDTWPGFSDDSTYNVIDNLVFTYEKTIYTTNPILQCTLAQWFGGSLSGLGNGDCLMVTGNPAEPNKFWWSAMDDLTYWPANNFNSCGDSTDVITAFGKQSNSLFAFTADTVYRISYNATQPSSTTIPYEPFPRSQLSDKIGCDCPDTIELVDNCLTWLHSNGKVYRMVAIENTDENAIIPISKNIELKIALNETAQLQNATACDTGEYYIIFAGLNAYAWDYDLVSFINYSSSQKSQDRLAWFWWDTPSMQFNAFSDNGKIYTWGGDYVYDDNSVYDLGNIINSYIFTKDFDFGDPAYLKSVYSQWFTVMADDGILSLEVQDDFGPLALPQNVSGISTVSKTISFNQLSSMTQHYQGYVGRPTNSPGKFAVIEFAAAAQIGSRV